MSRTRALTIAGSDPSGGAGLQADLAVFAAFGCHGMAVVAGLTAQNSHDVRATHPVPGDFVALQLETLLADSPPGAVKTGMLASSGAVEAVADVWRSRIGVPLVVDPLIHTGGGTQIVDAAAARAVAALLVPNATIVTPNAHEAAALTGIEVCDVAGAIAAARRIVSLGAYAALVKGGHVPGSSVVDVLVERGRDEPLIFERARIATARRIHGTGCALSAAITAGIARGLELRPAVEVAGRYVHAAIRGACAAGEGALVLDFAVRVDGMPA